MWAVISTVVSRIRSERLLYDAERELSDLAKFLVNVVWKNEWIIISIISSNDISERKIRIKYIKCAKMMYSDSDDSENECSKQEDVRSW